MTIFGGKIVHARNFSKKICKRFNRVWTDTAIKMSDHLGNQTSEEIRPAIMRINQLADEGQRLLSTLGSPQLSTGGESFGPSSSSGLGGNTNPTSTSSASSRPPPRTSSITDSLRRLFPSFRNSEHQRY